MPRPTRRSAWPVVVLAGVLLLPVGYVLSVGPAAAMAARGQLPPEVWLCFYGHFDSAADQSEAFSRVYFWYCSWWHEYWPGKPDALPNA